MKTILLLLGFLLLAAVSSEATTRYVDNSSAIVGVGSCGTYSIANRNCAGTDGNAYSSITAGINASSSGDTIYVRTGTYTDQVGNSLWQSRNGTSNGRTKVLGYNGETWTNRVSACTNNAVWDLYMAQWWEFGNFVIDANSTCGVGIRFNEVSTDNYVHDFEIKNYVGTGSAKQGISGDPGVPQSARNRISYGWIHGPVGSWQSGNTDSHCLYVAGPGWIIENNLVEQCDGHGIQDFDNAALNTQDDTIIRNNVFRDTGSVGLGTYNGRNKQVYNNIVYRSGIAPVGRCAAGDCGGIEVALGGAPVEDTVIYSNTVYANVGYCIYVGADATRTTLRNNLCYANTGVGGNIISDNGTSTTQDHNACSSGCAVNLTSNPFIVATPTQPADFQLHAAPNGAINAGSPLGSPWNTDYAGNARGTAYDIGAYEYGGAVTVNVVINQPAGCSGTSAACTITSTPNPVTLTGSTNQTGGSVVALNDRDSTNPQTASGSWTVSLTLKSGINNIRVTGTDGTGNSGFADIVVTYAPTFPGNALVAAYGFEEVSGTTVTDSSGIPQPNNGTLINTPVRNPNGFSGKAITLDGINQFVNVDNANTLNFTQSFTLSLRVKPATGTNTFTAAIAKGTIALFASQNGTYCANGGPTIWFRANGILATDYYACWPFALQTQWTHLAASYDGTSLKLYVNGVLQATTPVSPQAYMEPSTVPLTIGASTPLGGGTPVAYFDGDVDEPRLYNYAIPRQGALNTTPGVACQSASEESSSPAGTPAEGWSGPSIVGAMNCPVVATTAPIAFKIGAGSSLKVGATGGSLKVGQVPQ